MYIHTIYIYKYRDTHESILRQLEQGFASGLRSRNKTLHEVTSVDLIMNNNVGEV